MTDLVAIRKEVHTHALSTGSTKECIYTYLLAGQARASSNAATIMTAASRPVMHGAVKVRRSAATCRVGSKPLSSSHRATLIGCSGNDDNRIAAAPTPEHQVTADAEDNGTTGSQQQNSFTHDLGETVDFVAEQTGHRYNITVLESKKITNANLPPPTVGSASW